MPAIAPFRKRNVVSFLERSPAATAGYDLLPDNLPTIFEPGADEIIVAPTGNRPPERDPVKALQKAMIAGGQELFHLVPGFLRDIIEDRMWESRVDAEGRPFTSFKAFAESPMWEGLGTPLHRLTDCCWKHPDVVRLIQTSVPELPEHGEIGNGRRGSVATSTGRGTAYLAARLKRDRPDLLQAVADGEMTVRAAAKTAGIVKPPDPYKQLCKWWNAAAENQRAEFENHIANCRGSAAAEDAAPKEQLDEQVIARARAAFIDVLTRVGSAGGLAFAFELESLACAWEPAGAAQ